MLQQSVDTWRLPGLRLHALMDRLREQAPLVPVRFMDAPAWLITQHGALEVAFKDAESFPPHLTYQLGIEPVIGQTFQSMEGAQHRFYRKLATPTFRPRVVERMDETMLADVADELIEQFVSDGQSDLVAQFTERYPYMVIARLLGIPRNEEEQFSRWVVGILQFNWQPEQALRCRDELWAYLVPVLAERRRSPKDDVISQLLHDELDGVRMNNEQVLAHIGIMFTAGSSTTHNAIGNLLSGLLSGVGLWQDVRENAQLRDNAIEEALRWESAVSILPRLSRLDAATEFGGVELPPGSFVLMGICAANHDPEVFDEPHVFDIHRDSSRKITFGHGARTCPGMHLVRRELRVTLDILLER
ncbi:MAG: cytochrome P450, partial [Bacteroidia bacterium]